MAGLDPHKTSFSDLPPHFDVGTENKDIEEFMMLCYGPIICKYEDEFCMSSCLLLFAANLVYHQDRFQEVITRYPNHFFAQLPMFTYPELLTRVTGHVTYHPTKGVMKKPTGVPPHLKIIGMLCELYLDIHETKESLEHLLSKISSEVEKGI